MNILDMVTSLGWFWLAFFAMLFFGWGSSFMKSVAMQKQNPGAAIVWITVVVVVTTLLLFGVPDDIVDISLRDIGLFFAWSSTWVTVFWLYVKKLQSADVSLVLPIVSLLSTLVVVVYGMVYLNDTMTFVQALGVMLLLLSLTALVYKKQTLEILYSMRQLLLLNIIALAIMKVLSKYLLLTGLSIPTLLIMQHGAGFVCGVMLLIGTGFLSRGRLQDFRDAFRTGVTIGVFFFLGALLLFSSLGSEGSNTGIVFCINSCSILVASLVAVAIHGEKLTLWRASMLCVALIALYFVKV